MTHENNGRHVESNGNCMKDLMSGTIVESMNTTYSGAIRQVVEDVQPIEYHLYVHQEK